MFGGMIVMPLYFQVVRGQDVIATVPFVFLGTRTSYVLLCLVTVIRGTGIGLSLTPAMTAVYRALPAGKIADALATERPAAAGTRSLGETDDRAGIRQDACLAHPRLEIHGYAPAGQLLRDNAARMDGRA